MIYLIICLFVTTLIFIIMRLYPIFNINNFQAITINYIIAGLLGIILFKGNINDLLTYKEPWFMYGVILGTLFIIGFQLFAITTQKAGISITVVVTKISMVIPIIISFLFYNDNIELTRIAGIIIALLSLYFLVYSTKKRKKADIYVLTLIILLFFMVGINDSILNYNQRSYINSNNDLYRFLIIVFTTAFIEGIMIILFKSLKNKTKNKISKYNILGGTALGLCNFGSTFFMIKALASFPASMFFPIFNIGLTILSIGSGIFFFKEKLNKINWVGVLLSIIAVILISIS